MATRTMLILTLGLATVAVAEMCTHDGKEIAPLVDFDGGGFDCYFTDRCKAICTLMPPPSTTPKPRIKACTLPNGTAIASLVDFQYHGFDCFFSDICRAICAPPLIPPTTTPLPKIKVMCQYKNGKEYEPWRRFHDGGESCIFFSDCSSSCVPLSPPTTPPPPKIKACKRKNGKDIQPFVAFLNGSNICMFDIICEAACNPIPQLPQKRDLRSRQMPEITAANEKCKLKNGTEVEPGVDFNQGEDSCFFYPNCDIACIPPPPPPPPHSVEIKGYYNGQMVSFNTEKKKALKANDTCPNLDEPGTTIKSGVEVVGCFWSAGCKVNNCLIPMEDPNKQ